MGLEIDRERFEADEYRRFGGRLESCLETLAAMLEAPGFGVGAPSLGAELEVSLVDAAARPLPLNQEVLARTLDPRMTYELDRFNLECNLRHCDLAGRPFAHLRAELESARRELSRAADAVDGRIAMVGILPTLQERDLQSDAMTDSLRYRALSRALRAERHGPFQLHIDGRDPLRLACRDVTLEGAATSLQIHLRVDPADFARVFNAAQLATLPALAASGNSPLFLGHRLWEETRVALFKQAVDARDAAERRQGRQSRVSFGSGWVRDGALELFQEAVAEFPPLLPVLSEEEPGRCLEEGGVPRLEEIRLHQGTVWGWNRPVYDPHDGGHLRIELRALPAGPSIEDMLANVAFLVGLTLGLAPRVDEWIDEVAFEDAHAGFYRAARFGLEAELPWPASLGGGDAVSARSLVASSTEIALAGLAAAGVDAEDAKPWIECVRRRAEEGRTGARWQRQVLASLEGEGRARDEALSALVERYLDLSRSGVPVDGWPLPR